MENFFGKVKDQCMESACEHAIETKLDKLKQQEGDSAVGRFLSVMEGSGLEVKDCMRAADQMGFGVKDVAGAAEKMGLDTGDCIKLFAGAQKDDKGDVLDTFKSVIGGREQQESGGFDIGRLLKGGDDQGGKDQGGVNVGKVLGSLF